MPSKLTLLVILLSFPAYIYLSINQYLSTLWIIVYLIFGIYALIIFGITKFKKHNHTTKDYVMDLDEFLSQFRPDKKDYLLMAHKAEMSANKALKEKKLDEAWRGYHLQKKYYLLHAKRSQFTQKQLLALDASVSEGLANILRLENKPYDALTHIIWWVGTTDATRVTKKQRQKLKSYFNRCKFKSLITFQMLSHLVFETCQKPRFEHIQRQITEWENSHGISERLIEVK